MSAGERFDNVSCSQGFQVLDRGSVASKMAMEMQVQVQIGHTRRVFFMNPPRGVEEVTKAITREIPKTNFMDTCEFPRLESLLALRQKNFSLLGSFEDK